MKFVISLFAALMLSVPLAYASTSMSDGLGDVIAQDAIMLNAIRSLNIEGADAEVALKSTTNVQEFETFKLSALRSFLSEVAYGADAVGQDGDVLQLLNRLNDGEIARGQPLTIPIVS